MDGDASYYEDFNSTFDYSNIDYENYLYEVSNGSNKSYTASYEKEDSRSIDDDGTYGYDPNSTVIPNFLTDSIITEDVYINSTTQDETTTSTIETNTTNGTDLYLTSYNQIINYDRAIDTLYYLIFNI